MLNVLFGVDKNHHDPVVIFRRYLRGVVNELSSMKISCQVHAARLRSGELCVRVAQWGWYMVRG